MLNLNSYRRYFTEISNKYKREAMLLKRKRPTKWHLQQYRMRELRSERENIRQIFLERGVFIKKRRPTRKHTKHKRRYGKIKILPFLIGEGALAPWKEWESST